MLIRVNVYTGIHNNRAFVDKAICHTKLRVLAEKADGVMRFDGSIAHTSTNKIDAQIIEGKYKGMWIYVDQRNVTTLPALEQLALEAE